MRQVIGGFVAIVGLAIVAVTLLKYGRKPDEPSAPAPAAPTCDRQARDARAKWLDTPTARRDDHPTHAQLGYRADGECLEKLVDRQLTCDNVKVDTRDNPIVRDAYYAGFETYVCIPVGKPDRRAEWTMREVLDVP